jgi:hypothetical protein
MMIDLKSRLRPCRGRLFDSAALVRSSDARRPGSTCATAAAPYYPDAQSIREEPS